STTSAAQAHEASWSPSRIVASTARGEHARRAMCVADEPPRLAPDSLIERVGMPDLGRNRRAAMYTKGAKADVAFCPKGTAPGRHRRTSLAFGDARTTSDCALRRRRPNRVAHSPGHHPRSGGAPGSRSRGV